MKTTYVKIFTNFSLLRSILVFVIVSLYCFQVTAQEQSSAENVNNLTLGKITQIDMTNGIIAINSTEYKFEINRPIVITSEGQKRRLSANLINSDIFFSHHDELILSIQVVGSEDIDMPPDSSFILPQQPD